MINPGPETNNSHKDKKRSFKFLPPTEGLVVISHVTRFPPCPLYPPGLSLEPHLPVSLMGVSHPDQPVEPLQPVHHVIESEGNGQEGEHPPGFNLESEKGEQDQYRETESHPR